MCHLILLKILFRYLRENSIFLQWFYLGYLHDLLAVWCSVWTGLLGVDNVFLLHAGFYVCYQLGLHEGTPVPSGKKTWERGVK